jgi:hypothetical protein
MDKNSSDGRSDISLFGRYSLVIVAFCAFSYATWQAIDIVRNANHYIYKSFEFRSRDSRWVAAIDEASKVESGLGECATYACRYLILMDPRSTKHNAVIEKRLTPR